MSDIKIENLDSQAVPFFARFLETQLPEDLTEQEISEINGGRGGGIAITLKYPSDNEDVVTKKYPSDSDDAVTMKYPSDGDDNITTF